MASISTDKNGNRTIQFVASDRKRRSIRLGKMAKRDAEAIKVRVEALNVAKMTGHSVDGETARWIAGLEQVLSDKLAAVGLIQRRTFSDITLGAFIDQHPRGNH